MTLDEAIKHCADIAVSEPCKACADEHWQLHEWLSELKGWRAKYGGVDPSMGGERS